MLLSVNDHGDDVWRSDQQILLDLQAGAAPSIVSFLLSVPVAVTGLFFIGSYDKRGHFFLWALDGGLEPLHLNIRFHNNK